MIQRSTGNELPRKKPRSMRTFSSFSFDPKVDSHLFALLHWSCEPSGL